MLSPTPPINRPSLHPGAGYLIGPRVPHGLAAVVEGLTREVLRHRPEDIYVFAAHHFEKLLKLREQYHAEKYRDIREFDDDLDREFNLWPTKESTKDIKVSPTSNWSSNKEEVKMFERRGKESTTDVEGSPEDVSTDQEKRKVSKQTCTTKTSSSTTKRAARRSTTTKDKDLTSDSRATKMIPQMSVLRSSSKIILTKDIKQELRKNKLNSGEKEKLSDSVEKGIRGERRSRTKVSKTNKGDIEEELEHAATSTTGKTSARRPLKKVRRIETESETETERETVAKDRVGNGYERASVKGDNGEREVATTHGGSRGRRSEAMAWPSEHSSGRKVSSRALSMDRIRAYVLRKFASTASLEVLRSPTYVEQVQEVIDRAAPIIKEKLEEIREPRNKRSRSVDFAWNEESLRRCYAKDSKRCGDRDGEERIKQKSSNGVFKQESNGRNLKKDKSEDQAARRGEMTPNTSESEEKRPGSRRSSGRRSRRRESGELGIADRVNDEIESHDNKSEQESDVGRDTLEARLTATQSILEGISMSTSELNGSRKADAVVDERGEPTVSSEASDHVNGVSLPIVRPPSAKSCRNTAKNGLDSLTLPPISPEAPRSTKKKDELSLPVLSTASNGNHSKRSQEQDGSKDVEEASTTRDITSDMEDIAILPGDEDGRAIVGEKQDLMNSHQDLTSDARLPTDGKESEEDKDVDVSLDRDLEEHPKESTEPRAEEKKIEEIDKDSLNVTPEVVDVPPRPDSLEPEDEDEREKSQDEDADGNDVRNNKFDDLKDRLIEIEMAERNIEKALAGQQNTTRDEVTSEMGRSTSVEEIDEARKSIGEEAKEIASEIEKSTSERGTPNKEERKSTNEEEKEEEASANEVERGKNDNAKRSVNDEKIPSEERKSMNGEEKKEESANEAKEDSKNAEISMNGREIPSEERKSTNGEKEKEESINEAEEESNNIEILSEERKSANGKEEEESTNEAESFRMMANKESIGEEGSKTQTGLSANEEKKKVPNGVEDLMVKRHLTNLESTNTRYQMKNDQKVEASGRSGGKDDASNEEETVTANVSSRTTDSRNTATVNEHSRRTSPSTDRSDVGRTKSRKRREANEASTTTPLSLKIPFSYVLSEGSPCEIPDSVTTVIIPDRPCPSPVTETEDHQSGSTYPLIEKATVHDNTVEDVSSKDEARQDDDDRAEYEAFGEYIRPEVAAMAANVDFVHGTKGAKSGQDIVIIHQDLDRIKEEGEEEEEDEAQKEEESHLEKKDGGSAAETAVGQTEETAKLEDITEHEESEANTKTITEEIPLRVAGSEALPEITDSVTSAGKTDVAGEQSRSTFDNSSEENGSSQDIQTTTSSEAKESTVSNQSIESSSVDRPIVPELNLDSLQDNTVSSFKMTANGTATKESNSSPRESDTTMSLVEPLTPDERLTMGNRLVLADRELETPRVEELALSSPNLRPQSDAPEADQLYPAEHAEYELLEKDPLSPEALEDEKAKAQEKDAIGSEASPHAARVDSTSRKKRESEELNSEEEIARELIGLLDKDAQLRESSDEKKPEEGEAAENNLDDGIGRPSSDSVHSVSVDKAEEEKGAALSERLRKLDDKSVSKTEAISEVSGHIADSSQENEAESKIMANQEIEDSRLEVEEKKHVDSSQVAAKSERDESSAKDKATTNEESEEPKEEVEEKYIETNQLTSRAESERDESSAKDKVTTNEESEEPKEEVEKKHIETNQLTSRAKSERDESSAKDKATINEESEISKEEEVEKKHIETNQLTFQAESERDESSAKDKTTVNEELEKPQEEAEKKHIETNQLTSRAESERDALSAKDTATSNEKTEEPKVVEEIVEQKHIETSQVAPLAEFERDDSSEKSESHEKPDAKITAEDERDVIDADIAGDQKSPEDKRADVQSVPKSQSNESTSEIEEAHRKPEEKKHEEREDRGKSEEDHVEMQEEYQKRKLSDEEKESMAHEEDNQEHMDMQEVTESREDSLKKSTEENEDAGHEGVADDQTAKDATSEKNKETDDLMAKIESVHGPITSAISTQDYHLARYWTMGTKSSTAETVISAGSNTSADEETKIGDEPVTREKDDFHSAALKIQAYIRGFLARRRLRKDSVVKDIPLAHGTAASNEHLLMPDNRSSLREGRSGRHRLRREEALRKTTLSLENAFATSRLQHTGEFHDTVPLPLFDLTHSETNSNDSLDEDSLDGEEEELTKTDTAKSSTCGTDSNCHDDERRGSSQKGNVFADHSDLPIVMQLLADASRNCHFRINRDSNHPDLDLSAGEAKLIEPALDILMLGYPRDDATLQNRYLNFITSVEDMGTNMDYLHPNIAARRANEAQPTSATSGEASMPESLREPLALPGTPQGVVIEELTSLDETAGNVSSMKSTESTKTSSATKTSLDTNSSVPLEECTPEDKKNSESRIEDPADKDNTINGQKNKTEEVGEKSGNSSAVAGNPPSVGDVGSHPEDASERSNGTFHNNNEHAGERENGKA